MTFAAGARVGPYEILAAIGAGGMGEVYRARDSKLDRDVALKVLPDSFSADAERVARFEREAKTLAALNHPHIAQIYGFEQQGPASALVMELVDGDTLAQRLARGAIPLDEALPIAKQIADALAHLRDARAFLAELRAPDASMTFATGTRLGPYEIRDGRRFLAIEDRSGFRYGGAPR